MEKKAGAAKVKKGAKAPPEKLREARGGAQAPQGMRAWLRLVKPRRPAVQGQPAKAPEKPKKKAAPRGRPKKALLQEFVRFLQNSWSELKKVHWPSRSEVVVYTGVVLGSVIVLALLIWLADSVLSRLLELLL